MQLEKKKQLKKKLNKKTLLGLASIMMAVLLVYVVSPVYNRALEGRVEIVQVVRDIPKGEKIEASDIKVVSVGSYNLPEKVIKKSGDVVGSYAEAFLAEGDYILESKLSKEPLTANSYLYNMKEGMHAVSIKIADFPSGLSGKIEPGDIISIIAFLSEEEGSRIPEELQYVKVLNVTTELGKDANTEHIREGISKENIPETITLEVYESQLESLVYYSYAANIHISLAHRGDASGEKLLAKQKQVLDEIEIDKELLRLKEEVMQGTDNTEEEEIIGKESDVE